ncbi:TlpA family protein disulfide reductase [Kribbella swartbergensis]
MNHKLGSRTPLCLIVGLVALIGLVACGPEQADGPKPAASTSRTAVAGAEKLTACPATASKPPVSGGLPDVSLPCLGNGPDIRLADLRGPLLVNVWAQWCPPCRDEAPYLAELQKKSAGKLQLIGIDYDDPRPELAVKFAVEHQLTYPHLVDAEKAVHQPLKIGGPPVTAFVDKDGVVVHVHHGAFTSQSQLDQLVQEKLGVTP